MKYTTPEIKETTAIRNILRHPPKHREERIVCLALQAASLTEVLRQRFEVEDASGVFRWMRQTSPKHGDELQHLEEERIYGLLTLRGLIDQVLEASSHDELDAISLKIARCVSLVEHCEKAKELYLDQITITHISEAA